MFDKNAVIRETATKFTLMEAFIDGLISDEERVNGFDAAENETPVTVVVSGGTIIQITDAGLQCDCGKGLLCPQNIQIAPPSGISDL